MESLRAFRSHGYLLAIILIAIGIGCASRGRITGEVPYYLGKDIVVAEAVVTWVNKGAVCVGPASMVKENQKCSESDLQQEDAKGGNLVPYYSSKFGKVDASVSLGTVPDTSARRRFFLNNSSAKSDDEFVVQLFDSGLLHSIGVESEGKGSTFLKSLARLAGVFLPFTSGEGPRADDPMVSVVYAKESDIESLVTKDGLKRDEPCLKLVGSTEERYFLIKNKAWCEKLRDIEKLGEEVKNLEAVRDELLDPKDLKKVAKRDEAYVLRTKLGVIADAISRLQEKTTIKVAKYKAAFDKFKSENAFGENLVIRNWREEFDLRELTDGQCGESEGSFHWKSRKEVEDCLSKENAKRVLDFFQKTGVVFSLALPGTTGDDFERKPQEVAVSSVNAGPEAQVGTESESSDVVRVRYRPAYPAIFKTYVLKEISTTVEDKSKKPQKEYRVVLQSVDYVNALHSEAKEREFSFTRKFFSKGALKVELDNQGHLKTVSGKSQAEAAGAVSAIADAAVTGRDEYANSLAKLVQNEENRRKLGLASLTSRVETLKKRKELLDNQLAVEGGTATYEQALRKQGLDAELELLKTELQLGQTQDTFEGQLELKRLETELNLLKRELELLKTRQGLRELREPN